MAEIVPILKVVIWPTLVLLVCIIFKDSIVELVRPSPNQDYSIKIGPGGVELIKVAKAAAAVAAGAAARVEAGSPLDQTALAANLASGIEASLRRREASQPRRILWVDDVPSNNDYLITAFRDLGVQVDLAKSTSEAETKLASNSYDLIISDMARPPDYEAGLHLIASLKERNINSPIIIYAARWAAEHKGQESATGSILITNDPSEVYSTVLRRLLNRT